MDFMFLTEAEKSSPYVEAFYRTLPQLEHELARGIRQEIDPADAVGYDTMDKMLAPGYLPGENGWCLLPEGGGYAAINTKLPGISHEKYIWWRQWRRQGDQDFQYKLWYPGKHYRFSQELGWIYEDIGRGPEHIFSYGIPSPQEIGLNPEALKASGVLSLHTNSFISRPEGASYETDPMKMVLAHFVREIPGGIELRSRFWLGYGIANGRLTCLQKEIPGEMPALMADHCAHEMTNLSNLIPMLYDAVQNKKH